VNSLSALLIHVRLEAPVLAPERADFVMAGPSADADARHVCHAHRGRFRDFRANHGNAEQIGLHLHQQVVAGRSAVDAQARDVQT
jgi:hypothetical protein